MKTSSLSMLLQDSDHLLVLTFKGQNESQTLDLCLNIHKVKEVVEFEHITPTNSDCAPFYGLLNYRGSPIPLVHINRLLSASATDRPEQGKALVVEIQSNWIAVALPSIGKLMRYNFSALSPPPAALQATGQKFFSGIIQEKDGYTYLFDIESALEAAGVRLSKSIDEVKPSDLLKGKRILLVEDSLLFQKKLTHTFAAWGCKVTVANNGKEGLDLLLGGSQFDLIFTDLEMPIMGGLELATRIKQNPELRGIPILFNSSLSNPAFIDEVKNSNLGRYIVKFDPVAIESELKLALSTNGPAAEDKRAA